MLKEAKQTLTKSFKEKHILEIIFVGEMLIRTRPTTLLQKNVIVVMYIIRQKQLYSLRSSLTMTASFIQ